MSDVFTEAPLVLSTPEGFKPVRERRGDKLYVDGIAVEKWQLSPDELEEFFPERYHDAYPEGQAPCPINGCDQAIFWHDKRSFTTHARNNHLDWYAKHRKAVTEARNVGEIKKMIVDEQKELEDAAKRQ